MQIIAYSSIAIGLIASFFDIRKRIIPNWLIFISFLAGVIAVVVISLKDNNFVNFAQGLICVFVNLIIFGFLARKKFIGFGDVKLLCLTSFLLGIFSLNLVIFALILTAIFNLIIWLFIKIFKLKITELPFAPILSTGILVTLIIFLVLGNLSFTFIKY